MLKLYTVIYNEASFIELQYNSFKKFLKDEFEFALINNSPSQEVVNQIYTTAKKLGAFTYSVNNPRFDNGGLSHQHALTYILKKHILEDDPSNTSVILDSDVFLVSPYSLEEDITGCHFAGLKQGADGFHFPWAGLIVLKNSCPKLGTLDMRGALVNTSNISDYIIPDPLLGWTFDNYDALRQIYTPFDSGALLGKYILDNNLQGKWFSLDFFENEEPKKLLPFELSLKYNNNYRFWLINNIFIHTGRSSNWDNRPEQEIVQKNAFIQEMMGYFLN